MGKTVIKIQNLSKQYRIGLKEKQAETLACQTGSLIKLLSIKTHNEIDKS